MRTILILLAALVMLSCSCCGPSAVELAAHQKAVESGLIQKKKTTVKITLQSGVKDTISVIHYGNLELYSENLYAREPQGISDITVAYKVAYFSILSEEAVEENTEKSQSP